MAKTATTAEEVQAAVDGVSLQQVIDSYADSRATEATQTAVHNYEQKYGLKNGTKVETLPDEDDITKNKNGGPEIPDWAQALIDSNKSLQEKLDRFESERTTTTRRERLSSVIDKLPPTLKKAYERTPLDNMSDDDFSSLLTEVTSEVETMTRDAQQMGAVFGRPSTSAKNAKAAADTSKEASEVEVDALADRLHI